MFEVMVQGTFSAAHRLLDYDGSEENVHGHTWKVEAFVCGNYIDTSGILIDFKELTKMLEETLANLDHKDLNTLDLFKELSPSSELIAKYIYKNLKPKVKDLTKVTVSESENHKASYWEKT